MTASSKLNIGSQSADFRGGTAASSVPGLLRLAQITPHLVPISRATVWRWVKLGRFPAPLKLSTRVTVWRAAEVQAWIDDYAGSVRVKPSG